MRIYTRAGDEGKTSLYGGTRLSKADVRIEAYGTLDELNAFLGALGDFPEVQHDEDQLSFLRAIQSDLFTWGSHLATDSDEAILRLPSVPSERMTAMEDWMDMQSEFLPELKNFVLPGGHPAVSAAHLCRVVCRRAERRVMALHHITPVAPELIAYLNRLSDVFFIWGRLLSLRTGSSEILWSAET